MVDDLQRPDAEYAPGSTQHRQPEHRGGDVELHGGPRAHQTGASTAVPDRYDQPELRRDTPAVLRGDQSILVIDAGIQRLPKLRAIVLDELHRERDLRAVRAAVRCVVGSGSLGAAQ